MSIRIENQDFMCPTGKIIKLSHYTENMKLVRENKTVVTTLLDESHDEGDMV